MVGAQQVGGNAKAIKVGFGFAVVSILMLIMF
jgi:hypothetical protein